MKVKFSRALRTHNHNKMEKLMHEENKHNDDTVLSRSVLLCTCMSSLESHWYTYAQVCTFTRNMLSHMRAHTHLLSSLNDRHLAYG